MQLDEDDLPVGRVLSRRDVLRLLAATSAAAVVGCKPASPRDAGATSVARPAGSAAVGGEVQSTVTGGLPPCVAKPELTVGPYFLDKQLDRSDIRVEPGTGTAVPGEPLTLAFKVQQIANGQCTPLGGAMVDVWQCDAAGMYSGVNDRMVGFNTEGKKFLRGYQITDAAGLATFTTIYPGWYQGRAVHIHFKIRTPAQAALADQSAYEFTSQLFFDDSLTDQVHKAQPYAAKGTGRLRNERDGIFRQGGEALVLKVALGPNAYAAAFDVGLDLSNAATGRPERSGGPGGRPPRRP